MEKLGRVIIWRGSPAIEFRRVDYPSADRPKRVRLFGPPLFGERRKRRPEERFADEREARIWLDRIRAAVLGLAGQRPTPLYRVLLDLTGEAAPDHFMARWREWLEGKARRFHAGKLSKARHRELHQYAGRGYLAGFDGVPLQHIDTPRFRQWVEWLETLLRCARCQTPVDDVTGGAAAACARCHSTELERRLAPRSVKHVRDDVAEFLRWCLDHRFIDAMPRLPEIKVPKPGKRAPRHEDLRRVLEQIPDDERGLWICRAYVGLRPSESRRLDVRDYDFDTRLLTVRPEISKKRTGRELDLEILCPELVAWLERHRRAARPWQALFPNPRARAIAADGHINSRQGWTYTPERRVWLDAIRAAGVEYLEPNEGGRHAFATYAKERGAESQLVAELMGHTDPKSLDHYNHQSARSLALALYPERKPLRRRKRRSGGEQ